MIVYAVPAGEQIGIVNVLAVGSQRDLLAACNGPLLGHDVLTPGLVAGQCGPRWALEAEEKRICNAYASFCAMLLPLSVDTLDSSTRYHTPFGLADP